MLMSSRRVVTCYLLGAAMFLIVSCASAVSPTVVPPTNVPPVVVSTSITNVPTATPQPPTSIPDTATPFVVPTDTFTVVPQPPTPTQPASAADSPTSIPPNASPAPEKSEVAVAPSTPIPRSTATAVTGSAATSTLPAAIASSTPLSTATSLPTGTAIPTAVLSAKPTGGGTLSGIVSTTAGRPIAGAFVTVGFKSFKLVGQTDGGGRYSVTGIPDTPGVEVFSFAPGFAYDHSGGFPIPAGRVTTFNVRLASDANPSLDPVVSAVSVSPASVQAGGTVTFSLTMQSSQPMSDEVIAASGSLGRSALFVPTGGGRYQATFTVPPGVPPGSYSFAMFGATEQCEENARFPSVLLTVT